MAASEVIPQALVIAALQALQVLPLNAQRAAGDARITWTEDALKACAHDVETSGMKKPGNALWSSYLQHGQLPPMPKKAPAADELRCPFPDCDAGGDLSVCHGIHGYARTQPCFNCGKPLDQCWGRCPVKKTKKGKTAA